METSSLRYTSSGDSQRKETMLNFLPNALFTELSAVNKAFGRKFNIVSFRWLSPEEV